MTLWVSTNNGFSNQERARTSCAAIEGPSPCLSSHHARVFLKTVKVPEDSVLHGTKGEALEPGRASDQSSTRRRVQKPSRCVLLHVSMCINARVQGHLTKKSGGVHRWLGFDKASDTIQMDTVATEISFAARLVVLGNSLCDPYTSGCKQHWIPQRTRLWVKRPGASTQSRGLGAGRMWLWLCHKYSNCHAMEN